MTTGPYTERRAPSRRFLPPDPRVREPHRLTPQLALRVAVLGGLALVAFGVLFFRLWSLQVLSGEKYLNASQNNELRLIRVEAPRGLIPEQIVGHEHVRTGGGKIVADTLDRAQAHFAVVVLPHRAE